MSPTGFQQLQVSELRSKKDKANEGEPYYPAAAGLGSEWLWLPCSPTCDLPESIDIDKRPVKKFRQSLLGAPVAARGRENK